MTSLGPERGSGPVVIALRGEPDDEGRSLDCYRTGKSVSDIQEDRTAARWLQFAAAAPETGNARFMRSPCGYATRSSGR